MRNKKPDPIPFTKKAFEKHKLDFDRLKEEEQEVLKRLQTAREMGDLSENGAYKYAKFELGKVRRQLRQLRHWLRYGVVVEPSTSNVVDFGTKVTIKNEANQVTYLIVSKHESNPLEKKLSIESPLGQALAGKTVGQIITAQTPAGEIHYTIVSID